MHKNFSTDLSAALNTQLESKAAKSAPVELDASVLSKVGGGLAPRGTWLTETPASSAVVEAPRGTWL